MSTTTPTVINVSSLPTKTKTRAPRRRKAKSKAAKKRKAQRHNPNTSIPPAMRSWIMSLNDPFTHQGPKVGFGTLQPSTRVTGYVKTTLLCNADGSLAFYMCPTLGVTTVNMGYNNAGLTVATWNTVGFTNVAAIAAQANEARIISGAIRVVPLLAATAQPGIITAGSIPSTNQANMNAATPNQLIAAPYGTVGLAINGATINSRPIDDASFTFTNFTLVGGTGTLTNWSIPYVVVSGCPAATPVFIEAVLNAEVIGGLTAASSYIDAEQLNVPDSLAGGMYATAEQAFRFATKHINPSAVMSAAHEFASSGNAYNALDAGLRAMGSHSAAFRNPRHQQFTIEDVD
jgi:hypothetical protein